MTHQNQMNESKTKQQKDHKKPTNQQTTTTQQQQQKQQQQQQNRNKRPCSMQGAVKVTPFCFYLLLLLPEFLQFQLY